MNMLIIATLIFSLSTAITTVLLGDRNLISGNLFEVNKFFSVVFNYKFISAILFSFLARYSFMMINSSLLEFPKLAPNSTTITAFITLVSAIFVILANYLFLGEKLNFQQGLGAAVIILGTFIIFN